jgi:hypothetical protein
MRASTIVQPFNVAFGSLISSVGDPGVISRIPSISALTCA